ncbi:MAG TPA: hypothetical protein EYP04_06130 [Anaerolineae bacterium]|nr:hypothetical protein [Anaerolineae bacterium]HIQ05088.1 hypothetical protein [Anaerolineae bacterium]
MTIGDINPFQCGRPIADPDAFFGRRRELRRLSSHLHQLHWVSVVGPRRIGKTSLLLQLRHRQVMTRMGLDPSLHAVAFVDCQGLSDLDSEGWQALLVKRAAKALGFSPVPPVRDSFEFQEAFHLLLAGGRKLILMLDEFESMVVNPHLDVDFFNLLRSLSTDMPLAIVTASRTSLSELTYQDRSVLSSPFFNVFNALRIGLLEEEAARALLRRPEAGFAAETVEFLLGLAGPHPFFLQLAGSYAFEWQKGGHLDETARAEVCQELQEELAKHLSYTWNHLSPRARYFLVTLPLVREHEPALRELQEACLVQDKAYLSPLVELFVRQQVVPDVVQAGGLWADLRRRQAVWCGQPISLSDLAYRVLCYFLRHPNRPIPWLQLELAVWGELENLPDDYQGNPERVDAAVNRVRKVLREIGAGTPIYLRSGAYTFDSSQLNPCP